MIEFEQKMDRLHGPHTTVLDQDHQGSYFRQDVWKWNGTVICTLRITELAEGVVAVEVKTPEQFAARMADKTLWRESALRCLREAQMLD
jgi:hypothetical protein